MTEEEAKTKWCPFVRITGESAKWHPMTNREDIVAPASPPSVACRCIGSACMAWRWHGVLSHGKRHVSDEAYHAANNPDVPPEHGGMNKGDVRLGHCGLAGKP